MFKFINHLKMESVKERKKKRKCEIRLVDLCSELTVKGKFQICFIKETCRKHARFMRDPVIRAELARET